MISGDFFGWQNALVGGVLGLSIAAIPTTIMYICLSMSIAELSTMKYGDGESAGGPYFFVLQAMGSTPAFFAGLAETLKVVIVCAVVATGIGAYITSLIGAEETWSPVIWFGFYLLFNAFNIIGVELSFKLQLGFTILSVLLLVLFYVAAIPQVNFNRWVIQEQWMYPLGFEGVIKSLPYTIWFYLGIEELPLVVTTTVEPKVNMPRGIIVSMMVLILLGVCTVFFSCSIPPGAKEVAGSTSPLLLGYIQVFGSNSLTKVLTWTLLVGLISSFHSFIFCMGHLIHAMAHDGLYPKIISSLVRFMIYSFTISWRGLSVVTFNFFQHPKFKTPYLALISGSSLGLIVSMSIFYLTGSVNVLGAIL